MAQGLMMPTAKPEDTTQVHSLSGRRHTLSEFLSICKVARPTWRRAISEFRVCEQWTGIGMLPLYTPNSLRFPAPSRDLQFNSAHTMLFCVSHLPY